MRVMTEINSCSECRHADHSGAYTQGGAKPICGHPVACSQRGYDWKKRVRPDWETIPSWCPLKCGNTY